MRTNIKHFGMALVLLAVGVSTNAFGFLGFGGTSWKEEVLLHDGSKIIAKRHKDRQGRHEIGQKPPTGDQSIEFTIPGTDRTLTWRDEYSKDVGSANFNLIALHILNGTPYIVNTAYGCLSYNKWGRPNPPYVVFMHDGQDWQRIQMTELPREFETINLIANDSREREIKEAAKLRGYVPESAIFKLNASLSQPEYSSIRREPLPEVGKGCIKTDHYGKAGWLSPDWFYDKPSLNACLQFCEEKQIDPTTCPCQRFFETRK